MKQFTTLIDDGFVWNKAHERVWVMPWGRNGVRGSDEGSRIS